MKRFKVWLLLLLVFAAGFAGGIVTTRAAVRHFVRQAVAKPELVRTRIERDLNQRLRLNPQQRQQVHRILHDSHQRLQTLRREFQPQLAGVLRDTRQDISSVLTPEQRVRFEEFQAENRAVLGAAGVRD